MRKELCRAGLESTLDREFWTNLLILDFVLFALGANVGLVGALVFVLRQGLYVARLGRNCCVEQKSTCLWLARPGTNAQDYIEGLCTLEPAPSPLDLFCFCPVWVWIHAMTLLVSSFWQA